MNYDLGEIRKLINDACGDDELKNLCFDYFPSVYNEFTDGQTKSSRVRKLVDYANRQQEIDKLLEAISDINHGKYIDYESRLGRRVASNEKFQKGKINLKIALAIYFSTLFIVWIIRGFGLLEPFELVLYDIFLRQGPNANRVLLRREETRQTSESFPLVSVVEIESGYLRTTGVNCGGSICDEALLQILESIEEISPDSLIGLDIYRDQVLIISNDFSNSTPRQTENESSLEPNQKLIQYLDESPSIILGCFSDPDETRVGQHGKEIRIKDPDRTRTGFINYPPDSSLLMGMSARRYLLLQNEARNTPGKCVADYSLALQLAFRYLEKIGKDYGIYPSKSDPAYIQLVDSKVEPLVTNFPGGYNPKKFQNKGFQVLQNYNFEELLLKAASPDEIIRNAERVREIKSNSGLTEEEKNIRISEIRKKSNLTDLVLIGYRLDPETEDNDLHDTPLGNKPGVYLHAIALQQLLLEANDSQARTFIQTIDRLEENILIVVISGIGCTLIFLLSHSERKLVAFIISLSFLTWILCIYAFTAQGFWLPILPIQLTLALVLVISLTIQRTQLIVNKKN